MNKIALALLATILLMGCSSKGEFCSVDAETFARVIAKERIQLVDVRTPEEYAEGHIPRAINIDVNGADFDVQTGQLDKSRPVALYCRSGRRSKIAAERMAKQGFKVTELDGGILSWEGDKSTSDSPISK